MQLRIGNRSNSTRNNEEPYNFGLGARMAHILSWRFPFAFFSKKDAGTRDNDAPAEG